MITLAQALACVCLAAAWSSPVRAHEISLDLGAAEATLEALGKPQLTEAEARRIAQLPANRTLVRKMLTYGPAPTEDRMVAEMLAAARRQPLADLSWYRFEEVRDHREAALQTLAAFKKDPSAVTRFVSARLAAFSPPGPPQQLNGFLIAGGRPTGFTLGGTDFYLNIGRFWNEPGAARIILAHELFHAVRASALRAAGRPEDELDPKWLAAMTSPRARNAYKVRSYLDSLLEEGLANYVGDPMLMPDEGPYSHLSRDQLQGELRRPELLSGLLDVALVALTAERPARYEDAYGVGFYGWASPMYALGYQMVGAIAAAGGEARIRQLALGDGCGLVTAYLELAQRDARLPPLGPRTRQLAAEYC